MFAVFFSDITKILKIIFLYCTIIYINVENFLNSSMDCFKKGETKKKIDNLFPYVEKNGDIYAWILECNKDEQIGEFAKVKIDRVKQHKTGSRIKGYFLQNNSIFLYEPYDSNNKRNVKIKVGNIADKNILNSIKNGESNCLDKLLEYSKTASSIYNGILPLGESSEIVSKMKLNEYSYYYVYFELDDENGKYYPVEDTSLYMAYPNGHGNIYLAYYLDDKFKWNIENNQNQPESSPTPEASNNNKAKDDTTAKRDILKAGTKNIIISALLFVFVVGIILAIKNAKYKDIK